MRSSLVFIMVMLAGSVTGQTVGQKFTPPPTDEPPEIKKMIDTSQMWLESRQTTTTGLLKDVKLVKAHEYPRFRKLVRDFAAVGKTTIVTIDEPGEPLIVSGTVYRSDGKPAKNALIYMYQTSSTGWYSDKAYHISGNEGDHRHARLFGYLRTDENGRYEIRTIKPGGYPGSELPAHIHFFVTAGEGQGAGSVGLEIQFADDPRLTPAMLERSKRDGSIICKTRPAPDGTLHADVDITMRGR